MKVIELLFLHLPERYIEAIANNLFDKNHLYREADTIEAEMLTLFDWHNSKEGYDFWDAVLTAITEGGRFPKIPLQIDYQPSTWILSGHVLHIMNSQDTRINISFDVDLARIMDIPDKGKREKILTLLN